MLTQLAAVLPMVFLAAGICYLWLALQVSRESTGKGTNAIQYFLFLVGSMILGSAFSFGTTDAHIYGIGRALSYFAGGFLPVVLYMVYREFTVSPAHRLVIAVLCIIPIATTVLAITNPWHHIIWSVVETDSGLKFTDITTNFWFSKVHAPFVYTLFGYSTVAMAGRLPTITRAHRKIIILILVCAVLPFVVSAGNTLLGIGPIDFPFTSSTLVLLLPVYWWVSIVLRAHNFSPLAYQTMFDHIRDPIFVLDDEQKVISANQPAQDLLETSESDLIGKGLWEDLPAARTALLGAQERDLKQTVRLQNDRFFELNIAPLVGPSGRTQGTVVICRDVTERRQALAALKDSEQLIRTLIEHSSNGMLRFARDELQPDKFRCTFANRSAERFLQSGDSTLVGMPLEKLSLLEPRKLLAVFGADRRKADGAGGLEFEIELNEGESWIRVICEPIGKDFSVTLLDITSGKHNESKILADALWDPLTGVLNRRGFEQSAVRSMGDSDVGAVFYLDLNQFKSLNDRFGHPAGGCLA